MSEPFFIALIGFFQLFPLQKNYLYPMVYLLIAIVLFAAILVYFRAVENLIRHAAGRERHFSGIQRRTHRTVCTAATCGTG